MLCCLSDTLDGHQSLPALRTKKHTDTNLTTLWRVLGDRQMPEWNLLMIIPPRLDLLGIAIVGQQGNTTVGVVPQIRVGRSLITHT